MENKNVKECPLSRRKMIPVRNLDTYEEKNNTRNDSYMGTYVSLFKSL